MNQNIQAAVERDVRLLIGDLHMQLIIQRAMLAETQQKLDATQPAANVAQGSQMQGINGGGLGPLGERTTTSASA